MGSSGLRIGEAVQLKKNDLTLIDKDHFMIIVRGKTTKTGKGRKTFMSKEATKAVYPYWKKANDFIFATTTNIRNAKGAEHERFNDIREKAGLTKKYDSVNRFEISLHNFRAFFITKISRTDASLAKRLAGQKAYLDSYDRLDDQEKLQVYKKIESQLFIYEEVPESDQIKEVRNNLEAKIEQLEVKQDNYLELIANGLIKIRKPDDPQFRYTIDMSELHKVLREQGKLKKKQA